MHVKKKEKMLRNLRECSKSILLCAKQESKKWTIIFSQSFIAVAEEAAAAAKSSLSSNFQR